MTLTRRDTFKYFIALLIFVLASVLLVPILSSNAGVVKARCAVDRMANDDPIVFPGQPGASHLHVFYGGKNVNAFTTAESLLAARLTTCQGQPQDFAGYWNPAIYVDGQLVNQGKVGVYWKDNNHTVEAIPIGMKFVAKGWGTNVFFACTNGSNNFTTPQNCAGKGNLKFRVFFPDCWDGVGLEPTSFAYGGKNACPAGFPRRIVQVLLQIELGIPSGIGKTITTAALPGMPNDYTQMHADFLNAMDPAAMQVIVNTLNS